MVAKALGDFKRHDMKFLICGLGSIGQRHYRNLKALGENDILVYRSGKGTNQDFVQKFVNEFQPQIVTDLSQALKEKPDVALLSNPTSYHVPVALEAAKAGCHLFIEKPLSHSLEGLEDLQNVATEKKLVTYVAYNLRFHPTLVDLKKCLASGEYGKPISFHAEMGERVTEWHPWEDYRTSYATRKDLGGGVILTQSHEMDYLCWLFGPVKDVASFGGKLSDLDIDVEDVAKILFRFESGMVGSLDIDYLKKPPKRSLEIVTTTGRFYWNYFTEEIKFIALDGSEPFKKIQHVERNVTFQTQLETFLACVKQGKQTENSLSEGIRVLKTTLAIKKALQDGQVIKVQK
jgi:predicted dehydrogenase